MKDGDLTICFFGIYNPDYIRNRVLKQGLEQNDVNIIECFSNKTGFLKYLDLVKKYWKIRKDFNVLLVAFPGYQVMFLARFLTKKKIIFDSFASIYESEVFDRKNTKKGSLKARYFWFIDKLSCKLADKVLLDTNEHIDYFVKEFGLNKGKFERIFIGVDDTYLKNLPIKVENKKFIIHFHGTNIPLQGIRYILEAADLLKEHSDIKFVFVGPGISENKEFLLDNVDMVGKISYSEVLDYIDSSDICLGIFGDTDKTHRVIPNKVFECASRKKPVITADTKVVRELFDDNDLLLIPTANSQELAKAILNLKNDPKKMDYLAQNGYNKVIKSSVPAILGKKLRDIIQDLI